MIKGINHKIIELTDTDSIYYEKAWLVVRPEYLSAEESVLRSEARKMLSSVGAPSSMSGKRTFWFWALRIGFSVLLGAAAGALIGFLL